jgi:acyl-coenzyme A synthetase/AMP-(fatty) acid ligase
MTNDDPQFIMYTSETTGDPKGARVFERKHPLLRHGRLAYTSHLCQRLSAPPEL